MAPPRSRPLHPDAAVIERLGGPAKLAALCGVGESAVRYWRSNGIARGWRAYLQARFPHTFQLAERAHQAAQRARHP